MPDNPNRSIPIVPSESESFDFHSDIESRKQVRKKISELLESEESCFVRVIRADWGAGKTHQKSIIEEYKDDEDVFISVKLSSLFNTYSDSDVFKDLITDVPFSSSWLLAAIFFIESKKDNGNNIPEYEQFEDALEYVQDTIDSLTSQGGKVYIFMDEVEELNEKDKETGSKILEGVSDAIDDDELAGWQEDHLNDVRFILSATHEAFYKLKNDDKLESVMGKIVRRWEKIDLEDLDKTDVYQFYLDLYKYLYEGELNSLPIRSEGIVEALNYASQGKPDNILRLVRKLNDAASSPDALDYINSEHILDVFKNTEVTSFGSEVEAIKTDEIDNIERELDDDETNLFELLVGEPAPISYEDLQNRLDLEKELLAVKNSLNRKLSDSDISKPVIGYRKIDSTFDEFLENFKTISGAEEDSREGKLKLDSEESISISGLKDKFVFPRYRDSGETIHIEEEFYSPDTQEEVSSMLDSINVQTSRMVVEQFISDNAGENLYYALNPRFLSSSIFPSALPYQMNFIEDNNEAYKLWQSVNINRTELFDEKMSNSLITALERSSEYEVSQIDEEKGVSIVELKFSGMEAKFGIISYPQKVTSEELDEVRDKYRKLDESSDQHIHGAILVYGEGEGLQNLIDNRPLQEDEALYLPVHISGHSSNVILANHLAEEKDLEIIGSLQKTTIDNELEKVGFNRAIEEWIENAEEKGKVIPDWDTTNLKKAIKDYRFFLNFPDDSYSAEEIYQKNNETVGNYRWFGRGGSDLPDHDSSNPIAKSTEPLAEAGFLESSTEKGETKFEVVNTAVENYIIKSTEDKNQIRDKKLFKRLVTSSDAFKDFENFENSYLQALTDKGVIKKENGHYLKKRSLEDLRSDVKEKKIEVESKIESLRGHNLNWIYYTKQKGDRLYKISEVREFIKGAWEQAESAHLDDNTQRMEYSYLLRRLENLLDKHFRKKRFYGAIDRVDIYKSNFKDLPESFGEIKSKLNIENDEKFREIKEFRELNEELRELLNKDIDEEKASEIRDKYQEEDKSKTIFKYNNDKDEQQRTHFSIKIYEVQNLVKEINEKHERIENLSDKIHSNLEKTNKNDVQASLKRKKDSCDQDQQPVTYNVLETVEDDLKNVEVGTLQNISEYDTLEELCEKVEDYFGDIKKNLVTIESILGNIGALKSAEKDARESLEELKKLREEADSFFEGSKMEEDYEELDKEQDLEDNYNELKKKTKNLESVIGSFDIQNSIKTLNRMRMEINTNRKSTINDLVSDYKGLIPIDDFESVISLLKDKDIEVEDIEHKKKELEDFKENDWQEGKSAEEVDQMVEEVRDSIKEKLEERYKSRDIYEFLTVLLGKRSEKIKKEELLQETDLDEEEIENSVKQLEEDGVVEMEYRLSFT